MKILKLLGLIRLSRYNLLMKNYIEEKEKLKNNLTQKEEIINRLEIELRLIRSKFETKRNLAQEWHNKSNAYELKYRKLEQEFLIQSRTTKKYYKRSERYRYRVRRIIQFLEELKLKDNKYGFIHKKALIIKDSNKKK